MDSHACLSATASSTMKSAVVNFNAAKLSPRSKEISTGLRQRNLTILRSVNTGRTKHANRTRGENPAKASFKLRTMPRQTRDVRLQPREARPCRARCTDSTALCSPFFIGAKRIVGRLTASQIASASAMSFLLVLTYRFTNCETTTEPGPV